MLFIETSGSWRAMGEQVGARFAEPLRRCMDRYCPWLLAEPRRYEEPIRSLRALLDEVCPDLLEETRGMAEGADLDADLLLGYRFFNEVRQRFSEGCSVVYLADGDQGSLLGRNCDLSPDFDPEIQLCRICRPDGSSATITTSYLGMAGGVGLNEHGLGTGGASAHTRASYGDSGLPGQVLNGLLLNHCRDVSQARSLVTEHSFLGKSCNMMVGDRHGASVLFEMAPGRTAVQMPRPPAEKWQLCTNFFLSGEIPIASEPEYLQSAYARYGRMRHRLDVDQVERSVEGMKGLLTEIAQPGVCETGCDGRVKTAYSQVMELRTGRMHYTPGHPAEADWVAPTLT